MGIVEDGDVGVESGKRCLLCLPGNIAGPSVPVPSHSLHINHHPGSGDSHLVSDFLMPTANTGRPGLRIAGNEGS